MVKPCWRLGGVQNGKTTKALSWYKDLGCHVSGEFSIAVVQANSLLEDQSQVESGPLNSLGLYGTFIGVYDGHGGPETSCFVNERLFSNLKKIVSKDEGMSADAIRKSFLATEEEFISRVRDQWRTCPQIASVGTCCLVGVICNGLIYIANAGDSRVVLGRSSARTGGRGISAIQLSEEHNVNHEPIRDELRLLHPDDPKIVSMKHNVWRVKGLIQVSRSIGDAYLKSPEFNREPLLTKFRLPKPFSKQILSPEPSIYIHEVNSTDEFLIFASDGLWEHLSNQEAVDIVHDNPRSGIARRLVKAALHAAAKKREMRYSDLKKIERGVRRHFHDDITVVVVFLDSCLRNINSSFSIKGGIARASDT